MDTAPWNTTYCIFSLRNLQLLRFELGAILLIQASSLTEFSLLGNWYKIFLPEHEQESFKFEDQEQHNLLKLATTSIVELITTLGMLNFNMVVIEWTSMLYLMHAQKNKRVEEIIFDFENEPMDVGLIQGIWNG